MTTDALLVTGALLILLICLVALAVAGVLANPPMAQWDDAAGIKWMDQNRRQRERRLRVNGLDQ